MDKKYSMQGIKDSLEMAKQCNKKTCSECTYDGMLDCAPKYDELTNIAEYLFEIAQTCQKPVNLDW